MPNLTTTSSPPVPRSLHDICEDVCRANCGQCWQVPELPCTTAIIAGRDGYHVARFGRAMRRGLISGDDLMIALRAAGVFTSATLIYDAMPGGTDAG